MASGRHSGGSHWHVSTEVVGAIDVGIIVSASTFNVTQIESNNAVSGGGSEGALATDGPPQNPNWLFSEPSLWGLGWALSDIASPLNPDPSDTCHDGASRPGSGWGDEFPNAGLDGV